MASPHHSDSLRTSVKCFQAGPHSPNAPRESPQPQPAQGKPTAPTRLYILKNTGQATGKASGSAQMSRGKELNHLGSKKACVGGTIEAEGRI